MIGLRLDTLGDYYFYNSLFICQGRVKQISIKILMEEVSLIKSTSRCFPILTQCLSQFWDNKRQLAFSRYLRWFGNGCT